MRPLDLHEKSGRKVTIYFEGKPYEAYEGETVSIALLANNVKWLSSSGMGRKRGAFYFGPVPVTIDGVRNQDARKTKVREGMRIERQTYFDFQEDVKIDADKGVERYVVDVAVAGGGVAGMGAALEMQEKLSVAIIEEKPALGGDLRRKSVFIEGFNRPAKEIVRDLASGLSEEVKVFTRTSLLGVFNEGEYFLLSAVRGEQLIEIIAKKVVLATGGVDNIMLFENNEMPGVFRRDFALEVINLWGVKPGKRVAVVGSKPEEITEELEKAEIEYILVKNPKRVEGEDSVERLIDHEGNVYEVDAVIVSDGRRPDINPITQAGGKIIFHKGAYVPVKNERNEILEGIYVAGTAASIKNHYANYLEGRLVGAHILEEMGLESRKEEIRKELEDVAVEEEAAVRRIDFSKLNLEDTFICGCDVTLGSIVDVIDRGITDLQIIKRLTHVAMGFCQGRYCLFNAVAVVSQRANEDMENIDVPVARPPIKNVKMKVMRNE